MSWRLSLAKYLKNSNPLNIWKNFNLLLNNKRILQCADVNFFNKLFIHNLSFIFLEVKLFFLKKNYWASKSNLQFLNISLSTSPIKFKKKKKNRVFLSTHPCISRLPLLFYNKSGGILFYNKSGGIQKTPFWKIFSLYYAYRSLSMDHSKFVSAATLRIKEASIEH